MKNRDLTELRKNEAKTLMVSVREKKLKEIKSKAERKVGKVKNLKEAAKLRREIAQLLTVMREKELYKK